MTVNDLLEKLERVPLDFLVCVGNTKTDDTYIAEDISINMVDKTFWIEIDN